MKRKLFASIEEVPGAILNAYRSGDYYFSPPPVCTAEWDDLAWINYVMFPFRLAPLLFDIDAPTAAPEPR